MIIFLTNIYEFFSLIIEINISVKYSKGISFYIT